MLANLYDIPLTLRLAYPSSMTSLRIESNHLIDLSLQWGELKLSGCFRDSISAFLAASAPKKLVFIADGETQRIFIFISSVSFSHLLVWMSSSASF